VTKSGAIPETMSHDRTVDDPLAEVRKIIETSERVANGDHPDEADHIRVLAGMIHLLAEQILRLSGQGGVSASESAGANTAVAPQTNPPARVDREVEIQAEEDRTPEHPPAEPAVDRTKT